MSGISERNPFVGPRSIEQGEPLYGRSTEVRKLFNWLQARRIVVLHSPSGAGKSSLVQAGLIPRLEQAKFDVWRLIRVNTDPQGFEGIPEGTNRYLLSAMISLEDELPKDHRRSPAQLAGLGFQDYLDSRPRRKARESRPVALLFDQFEEVLTVAPRALSEKLEFFRVLGEALDTKKYWALFIVREDFLAALAPYRDHIPTQLSNTFRMDLLGLEGAREAAEQLALTGGRAFPAVDQLIRDLSTTQVQQPDETFAPEQGLYVEPVHLQVVCHRLWEMMPDDDLSIDEEDIEQYAGVSESLGVYYAQAVQKIAADDPALERVIREWVGDKLIVDRIRSPIRREKGRSAGLDNSLIDQLLGSYLVRTEQRAGANWFELSHDRLVEPVLLDNEAWEREHLHPLQVQAKLWHNGGRAEALLLGAEGLDSAQVWARDNAGLLTDEERAFLKLSGDHQAEAAKKVEDAQRRLVLKVEEARRQQRRTAITAAVAVVTALLMAVLGVMAGVQARNAREATLKAIVATGDARDATRLAIGAEAAAKKAKAIAQRASLMAGARELLAAKQVIPASILLTKVENPREARGWAQLAIDILDQWVPRFTLPHDAGVGSATWSPNGALILTTSHDGRTRVWPADGSGDPLTLEGDEDGVWEASWSPDSRRVITVSKDGKARIQSASGDRQTLVLDGPDISINSAAWGPDGERILTTSPDGRARIWSAGGDAEPIVLDAGVTSAAWSPSGEFIVTTTVDHEARVWAADGEGKPAIFDDHRSPIRSAMWDPSSERIITTSRDAVMIWRVDGESKPIVLDKRMYGARFAAWSPDGERILTASWTTMQVWSGDGSGGPSEVGHLEEGIQSTAWSPDSKHIITTSEESARVWSANGLGSPILLDGHDDIINSATWSPDGKLVITASDDESARVWSPDRSGVVITLDGHDDWINSAAWSPDGQHIVTASDDKSARVWRADGELKPVILDGHEDMVTSVTWSPDGTRVLTASADHSARIWSADGSGAVVVLDGHEDWVNSATWSPDGARVLTVSDDDTARIWSADNSTTPIVLEAHENLINSAAWSPDGSHIVTTSDDHTARLWNADGSGTVVTLEGHEDWVNSATWNADSTRIVTASADNTARIWTTDGSYPIVLEGHEDAVISATWSPGPDNERIVTTSDDETARVWSAYGSTSITLEGHKGAVESATWSPDGERIITTSEDGTARIWNADGSGNPIILTDHHDEGTSPLRIAARRGLAFAAWAPDGERILIASNDGNVRVWHVDLPALQRGLVDVTTDCLSVEQRQDYLAEDRTLAVEGYGACERRRGRLRFGGVPYVSMVGLAVNDKAASGESTAPRPLATELCWHVVDVLLQTEGGEQAQVLEHVQAACQTSLGTIEARYEVLASCLLEADSADEVAACDQSMRPLEPWLGANVTPEVVCEHIMVLMQQKQLDQNSPMSPEDLSKNTKTCIATATKEKLRSLEDFHGQTTCLLRARSVDDLDQCVETHEAQQEGAVKAAAPAPPAAAATVAQVCEHVGAVANARARRKCKGGLDQAKKRYPALSTCLLAATTVQQIDRCEGSGWRARPPLGDLPLTTQAGSGEAVCEHIIALMKVEFSKQTDPSSKAEIERIRSLCLREAQRGDAPIDPARFRHAIADVMQLSMLDRDIRQSLKRYTSEVGRCYRAGLANDSEIGGKLVIDISIGSSGETTQAFVNRANTTLTDASVGACVAKAAGRWEFDDHNSSSNLSLTYDLSSR